MQLGRELVDPRLRPGQRRLSLCGGVCAGFAGLELRPGDRRSLQQRFVGRAREPPLRVGDPFELALELFEAAGLGFERIEEGP